jgi:hypothetical protein
VTFGHDEVPRFFKLGSCFNFFLETFIFFIFYSYVFFVFGWMRGWMVGRMDGKDDQTPLQADKTKDII